MRTLMHNSSALCAVTFTAIALLFGAQIDYGNLAESVVPIVCVALCLAAAAAEILRPAGGGVDWSVTGGLGLTLYAGYLLVIHIAGFLPATVVFVAAVFLCSGQKKGSAIAAGAVTGCILAAAIYGIFVYGMGSVLPMGMFE